MVITVLRSFLNPTRRSRHFYDTSFCTQHARLPKVVFTAVFLNLSVSRPFQISPSIARSRCLFVQRSRASQSKSGLIFFFFHFFFLPMFTVGRTRQILGPARLLKSGLLSDVQLVLGDRTWNLHQVTLVSRCAWFKTALTRLSVTSRRPKRARSYSRSRVGNLHNQNQCNQRRVHRQTASWRGLFTVGRLQALPDPTISSFAPLEAIHTPISPLFCASS